MKILLQISNHTVYNNDTEKCANQFKVYVLQPQILDFSVETRSNSSNIRLVPRKEDHDIIDQSAGIKHDYGYEFLYRKIKKNKYKWKSF